MMLGSVGMIEMRCESRRWCRAKKRRRVIDPVEEEGRSSAGSV